MSRSHVLGLLLSVAVLGNGRAVAEILEDSVDLRLKWEVGKRYVMRVENSQEMEITMMPGADPMRQTGRHSFNLAVSVLEALPEGGRTLEMIYLDAAFSMEMGGQTVSFDSRTDDPLDAANPLSIMSKMVGTKISCRLDGEGQIQSVDGLEEFAKRMTEGNPQAAQILQGFTNAESFRRNFGGYFGLQSLPRKSVIIGEEWSVEDEVPMGALGTFVNKMDYTFEGWEKDLAVLGCEGTLSSRAGDPIEQGGMDINLTVQNGRISGRSLFNPQHGTVDRASLETVADLRITVKGVDGVDRTMDQKLKQKYVAQLLKIEDLK